MNSDGFVHYHRELLSVLHKHVKQGSAASRSPIMLYYGVDVKI